MNILKYYFDDALFSWLDFFFFFKGFLFVKQKKKKINHLNIIFT